MPSPPSAQPPEITAPSASTVVDLPVAVGEEVRFGQTLVVLESMKMELPVAAEVDGRVDAVLVEVGQSVARGDVLMRLVLRAADAEPATGAPEDEAPEAERPELEALRARRRLTLDEGRPDAVARRHAGGRRTARENLADLCDPGSFVEYGAFAVAAQRQRRSEADLIERTPADGLVTGLATINADTFGPEAARAAVLSYDYTVLAGTQGQRNHLKTDRILELAERAALPVVLFAEGGGGRPGDTDIAWVAGLSVQAFGLFARLSGQVPLVGIVSGRCFAGNAALLGCCDVIIATPDANIGMGGPAMVEGGGLGRFRPEDIGPIEVQEANGVVDLVAADEAEAVRLARRYLSYVQGSWTDWVAPDATALRDVVPTRRVRVYDTRRAIEGVADRGSVLELRPGFGAGMVTALARIEGRAVGVVANDPRHLGGAIDRDGADKAARFFQLCEAHGLAVVTFCDTPGFMVGPDAEHQAQVRHFARMFVAGAALTVPLVTVVLRKCYGLGAMAMAGGSLRTPLRTAAWPTAELGGMGLEGAVRLGYAKELDAIEDPTERERAYDAMVAAAYRAGGALNAASYLELDDVIDPIETRAEIAAVLASAGSRRAAPRRRFIDPW